MACLGGINRCCTSSFAHPDTDAARALPCAVAVEVSNLGRALFTDCKFTGNTAGQGGAIAVYSGALQELGRISEQWLAMPAKYVRQDDAM